MAKTVKKLPAMQDTKVQSLGQEDPLEKEMATHSNILAWRIHRQRSLVGYIPWVCKKSDRTERLHFHFLFFSLVYNLHFVKKYADLHLYPCLMPYKSSGRSEVRHKWEIQGHLVGLWYRVF